MQPEDPMQRYDAQGRRLCSAHHRHDPNTLCNSPAVTGQNVCRMHGGSSPQAKASARMRLLELVDPAITRLARELENEESADIRLKAANSILDRAGYGRVSKVETADARTVLLERLLAMRAEAIMRGEPLAIDAEPEPEQP